MDIPPLLSVLLYCIGDMDWVDVGNETTPPHTGTHSVGIQYCCSLRIPCGSPSLTDSFSMADSDKLEGNCSPSVLRFLFVARKDKPARARSSANKEWTNVGRVRDQGMKHQFDFSSQANPSCFCAPGVKTALLRSIATSSYVPIARARVGPTR